MRPQTREDDIGKTCRSLGGKLHSFFFALGENDVVAIAELPDNAAAAAFSLGIALKGARLEIPYHGPADRCRGAGGDEEGAAD